MYTGKVILELLDAKSFHEEMLFSQPIDFKWAKYHIKNVYMMDTKELMEELCM